MVERVTPCTMLVGMRAGKACKLSRFPAIRGGLKCLILE